MNTEQLTDEDHHAVMNGPRIAQSLPDEFFTKLLQLADDKALQDHWKILEISQEQSRFEFPEAKPVNH